MTGAAAVTAATRRSTWSSGEIEDLAALVQAVVRVGARVRDVVRRRARAACRRRRRPGRARSSTSRRSASTRAVTCRRRTSSRGSRRSSRRATAAPPSATSCARGWARRARSSVPCASRGLWRSLEAVAHTLPYDYAVMNGTVHGTPLAHEPWASIATPTLVLDGGKSPASLHRGRGAHGDHAQRSTAHARRAEPQSLDEGARAGAGDFPDRR